MTIGIYKLIFSDVDTYIGQSIDIEKRFKQHIYNFKNNLASIKLSEAYKVYGIPILEIIEIAKSAESLSILEEFYIKYSLPTLNSIQFSTKEITESSLKRARGEDIKELLSLIREKNKVIETQRDALKEAYYLLEQNKLSCTAIDIQESVKIHKADTKLILRLKNIYEM